MNALSYRCQCTLKCCIDGESDIEETADIEILTNNLCPSTSVQLKIIFSLNQVFVLSKESVGSVEIDTDHFAIIQVRQEGPYFDISSICIRDKKMVSLLQSYWVNGGGRGGKSPIGPRSFYSLTSPDLSNTQPIFHIFSLQEKAFSFFDSLCAMTKAQAKIFSFESAITGKRRFLVSQTNEFLSRYTNIEAKHRHVYEIIREGYPCRLYFDIEFYCPSNPTLNGDMLCARWVAIICWRLFEIYGLAVGPEHVVELDSSTTDKFSRHLVFILLSSQKGQGGRGGRGQVWRGREGGGPTLLPALHAPELLFRNNIEVGHFVLSTIRDCVLEERGGGEEGKGGEEGGETVSWVLPRCVDCMQVRPCYEDMWVWNRDNQQRACFVDLGVYTRNRAFRLLLSSKYGKETCLRVARHVDRKVKGTDPFRCVDKKHKTNYLV